MGDQMHYSIPISFKNPLKVRVYTVYTHYEFYNINIGD